MATSSSALSNPPPAAPRRLRHLVSRSLSSQLLPNALFFASHLHALDPTPASLVLYAQTLLRADQPHEAYHLLHGQLADADAHGWALLADVCERLGRNREGAKAAERAVKALREGAQLDPDAAEEARAMGSAQQEAALRCKLGTLARKGNEPAKAAEHFTAALQLDPFLWEAFEGLCILGSDPSPSTFFPPRPRSASTSTATSTASARPANGTGVLPKPPPPSSGLGFFTPEVASHAGPSTRPFALAGHQAVQVETPVMAGRGRLEDPSFYTGDEPSTSFPNFRFDPGAGRTGAMKRSRAGGAKAVAFGSTVNANAPTKRGAQQNGRQLGELGTRRSTRLSSSVSKPAPPPPPPSRVPPTRDKRRKPTPPADTMPLSPTSSGPLSDVDEEAAETEDADAWILDMLRVLGKAHAALCSYRCSETVDVLLDLVGPELGGEAGGMGRNVGVLCWLGRAWFEMVDYQKAERAFSAARALAPHRLADMDTYSTLLWHMHRPVPLSFLAQELLATCRTSPQAWIAVGNSFSLQKDHGEALRCFVRAVQTEPNHAYAYVLAGHECVAREEWDRALGYFESAVRLDRRLYNTWYGLGSVYLKQAKLELAEFHFRKAAEINPSNAVLFCSIGMVKERVGDKQGALELYEQACAVAPDTPLCLYRRAKLLVALKQYKPALRDLLRLKDSAPDEVNVHVLLGRIYRSTEVEDKPAAARHFAIAQDLDPKSAGLIKDIVEGVEPEEDEDGEGSEMGEDLE